MPRKPRIEFPGAFYHVITRGNNKQRIFADDKDYRSFLARLAFYKERFKFVIYAYVLMPNHIHLLLETGEAPLSQIMQPLQFTYTQKFNHRHKKVGHLFQGRYKAILCQKESYLLELIRYIAQNPVRAKLVKRPIDWKWSSIYDLLRLKKGHVISVDEVLGLFGNRPATAALALQKHVERGDAGHNETYYNLKDQRVLGSDDFAKECIKFGDAIAGDFEYYNVEISEVIKIVAGCLGIGIEQITSMTRERAGAKARGVVAYISKRMCGRTAKEVSEHFGRSEQIFSKLIKGVELNVAEGHGKIAECVRQTSASIKRAHNPCIARIRKIK